MGDAALRRPCRPRSTAPAGANRRPRATLPWRPMRGPTWTPKRRTAPSARRPPRRRGPAAPRPPSSCRRRRDYDVATPPPDAMAPTAAAAVRRLFSLRFPPFWLDAKWKAIYDDSFSVRTVQRNDAEGLNSLGQITLFMIRVSLPVQPLTLHQQKNTQIRIRHTTTRIPLRICPSLTNGNLAE